MHPTRRGATRLRILFTSRFTSQSRQLHQSTPRCSSQVPNFDRGAKSNKSHQIARSLRRSVTSKNSTKSPSSDVEPWPSLKLQLNVDDMPSGAVKIPDVISPLSGKPQNVYRTKDSLIFFPHIGKGQRCTVELLRDACGCHLCRDVSSGQKSFSSTEIPNDVEILDVRAAEDGGLVVTIDKDMGRIGAERGHDILLSPEYVMKLMHPSVKRHLLPALNVQRYHVDHWDSEYIQQNVRKIDYEQFIETESTAFWDGIQDIMRLGLVFLKNVPRDEHSVERIAERISCIRETFYGRTFDVKAKPNAENVAYTSGYLGLHQDLLYLNPMPYIQILHCMDNDCEGGESLFSDADRVGRILQHLPREYQPLVQRLINVAVPYAYNKDGYNYSYRRPVLELDPCGSFKTVRWSPPFQAEFQDPVRLDTWIAAARVLEKAVNHSSAMFQTRMAPGECVIFNNQRVLHGRTAFDSSGGSRWLRGTYLSFEDFWSKASHAPTTHAAATTDRKSWWKPQEAERALQETEMAGRIKEWLETEKTGIRDYHVNNSLEESNKGSLSESMDALFPELTKRLKRREKPEW